MMKSFNRTSLIRSLLLVAVLTLAAMWLLNTPPGILGKADAIAYAVCHRMESHTYHMGQRQMPLCARDTGMHLGILTTILFHMIRGKQGGMPAKKIIVVLAIFFMAFAVDGINSTLPMLNFINLNQWYPPQNWLRLATGAGMGIAMGAMLMPVINQSLWKDVDEDSALKTWRQLGILVLVTGLASAAVVFEIPLLVTLLALLSAADVLFILTMIFTLIWVMMFKKDNLFQEWKELAWWLLAGFGTALSLIAIMDWIRFTMTGTWNGFLL